MSCYEWEAGTIKLPPAEFRRIRNLIAIRHNNREMERYALSQRYFSEPLAMRRKGAQAWLESRLNQPGTLQGDPDVTEIQRYDPIPKTYRRLRKKDLRVVKGASFVINHGDYTMSFGDNEIGWEVFENNRARGHAHRDPLARILFDELARVKWTPRSGGVLVGNDEYNNCSSEIGGGGNYITMVFGPAGKREQERHRGF